MKNQIHLPFLKDVFSILEGLTSVRIEGNGTTINDAVNISTTVDGNTDALEYRDFNDTLILARDNKIELTKTNILNIHKKITQKNLKYLSGDKTYTWGDWRKHQNGISNTDYITPKPELVEDAMDELIEDIGTASTVEDLAMIHHSFVSIHPFMDGNGRTARIITYLMLKQIDSEYWLVSPSSFFRANRDKYITMLNRANDGFTHEWKQYVVEGFNRNMKMKRLLLSFKHFNTNILTKVFEDKLLLNENEINIIQNSFYPRMKTNLLSRSGKWKIIKRLQNRNILGDDKNINWNSPELKEQVIEVLKELKYIKKV